MENNLRVKAAEFLIESLKLMVTISMLFIGGIVAYGGYIDFRLDCKYFYISISLLVVSSLLSVLNINSIINKIYAGNTEAIRATEVRVINAISIIALVFGISFGIFSILNSNIEPINKTVLGTHSTIITDSQISIGNNPLPPLKRIKKNGKIQSVEVN